MQKEYTISRTGQAPLRFAGEQLATWSSKTESGYLRNRYHTVTLFRDAGGRFVARIEYDTTWQGERAQQVALVAGSGEEIARALEEHDPTEYVGGFPAGEAYAARQERLLAEIDAGFRDCVGRVLQAAEITATVEDGLAELRQQRDLRRYRDILQRVLAALDLSIDEACCICDVLNGSGDFALYDPETDHWPFVRAEIEDGIRLNKTDEKWDVDGAALLQKLRGCEPVELLAIADAAERFWQSDLSRDGRELVVELGMAREETGEAQP